MVIQKVVQLCYKQGKIFLQIFLQQTKKLLESFYVELHIQNEKYLINCSYNNHKGMIMSRLATLSKFLDVHSSKYEKMLILGNLKVRIEGPQMKDLFETNNLTNLIKQSTCFESPDNPNALLLMFHVNFKALVLLTQDY